MLFQEIKQKFKKIKKVFKIKKRKEVKKKVAVKKEQPVTVPRTTPDPAYEQLHDDFLDEFFATHFWKFLNSLELVNFFRNISKLHVLAFYS